MGLNPGYLLKYFLLYQIPLTWSKTYLYDLSRSLVISKFWPVDLKHQIVNFNALFETSLQGFKNFAMKCVMTGIGINFVFNFLVDIRKNFGICIWIFISIVFWFKIDLSPSGFDSFKSIIVSSNKFQKYALARCTVHFRSLNSRCLMVSTDQADSRCFYFRIS